MKYDCYSEIASVYHLIFEDWNALIKQQSEMLHSLLPPANTLGPVLDCSCGIGTQSLALAMSGYEVEGMDLSKSSIERAQKEASMRGLSITFRIDDMRQLKTAPCTHYGVVISMDNSLPHLDSDEEIIMALTAMRDRLKQGGSLLLSLRDYGKLMEERPTYMSPRFFRDNAYRRTFHQVWDWQDERRYMVHFYITYENEEGWNVHHSVGQYRAIAVEELTVLAKKVGFTNIEILTPEATGFYQPIIRGIAV